MTTTLPRATVEQALEALERARPLKADYTTLEYFKEAKRKHYAAMAALRAALAQQAEPVGTRALIEECRAAFAQELAAWDIDPPLHHVKQAHDKCEAWLAALAQQAEPVCKCDLRTRLVGDGCEVCNPKLAAELAQQAEPVEPVEPVGAAGLFTLAHLWAQQCYFKGLGRPCDIDSARGAFEQALKAYTAPPQRKPLTDQEIERLWYPSTVIAEPGKRRVAFGRAIERAHNITDPQVADRLARHGIPMPEGDPK